MNAANSGLGYSAAAGKWGWFVLLGVVLLAAGFVALIDTVAVTVISAIFIGATMLVGGVFQIIHALAMKKTWGASALGLLGGVIYLVGGVLIMMEPIQGAIIITLFLLVAMVVGGILRVIISLRHRELPGWWLMLIGGVLSVVLGLILVMSMPWSGLWVLGTLVAIELLMHGVTWLQFGLSLRRLHGQRAAIA